MSATNLSPAHYVFKRQMDAGHFGLSTPNVYDERQIEKIQEATKSDAVKSRIEEQAEIVEDRIRTIKIPTIMFDGRRYDRVIGEEKLK